MDEKLARKELLIQGIFEREMRDLDDLTATVPVHLGIFRLPAYLRTDISLIADAKETVKLWFNEDMKYHLNCLHVGGTNPSIIQGYETFNDDWVFEWLPDEEGFLALIWHDGSRLDYIHFCTVPVFLYNQWDENNQFYTPEYLIKRNLIENIGRNLKDPEGVFMAPEKMKRYGIENDLARIQLDRGRAEVMGHAFCSNYQPNMGKALLLRDFAVFYVNRLLDKANESLN